MASKFAVKSGAVLAALAASLFGTSAFAAPHRALDPLPSQTHRPAHPLPPFHTTAGGTWTAPQHAYPGSFPETSLLLTDGTVIVHEGCTTGWYKLTPDSKGNYQKGTWSKTGSMPSGYGPLYFASQVLPDGRVILNGGEYINCNPVWSTQGALYDPVADKWTNVDPPSGWSTIGDAQSIVRTDGSYMLANCCDEDFAIASINGTNVTWDIHTQSQSHKADDNDEEGWTILPNQTVLTVDTWRGITNPNSSTELFDQATNTWSDGQDTVGQLVDQDSHEIGPGPLLPNGFVLYLGGTPVNSLMDTSTGKWHSAPSFPSGLESADGPSVVLPSGNVLAQVSPGVFAMPSHFFEVHVADAHNITMTQVSDTPTAPNQSSYEGRFLVLPTGQVLWTSDVDDVEIYTPTGHPKKAWKPKRIHVAGTLSVGSKNNRLKGRNLNGFTFGSYYGDDAQQSTNYPIVRITNTGTGDVCYARSHNFSRMGISDGSRSHAKFDIPNSCETGASTLEVVANGIASKPVNVTLQ